MKLSVALVTLLSFLLILGVMPLPTFGQEAQLLDPLGIPKWVNQLTGPLPVYVPANITDSSGNVIRQDYTVNITQFYQQILPTADMNGTPTGFGATQVWGYGGLAKDPVTGQYLGYVRGTPSPTFEAIRNLPLRVKWVNDLVDASGNPLSSMFAVDPTIHWANPSNMTTMSNSPVTAPLFPPGYADAQNPVPVVTHLHGGQDSSADDGNPDAWFTANGIHGSSYNTDVATEANAAIYTYPNTQESTTLWFHDHALGITRLSMMSGLHGFYILRDPTDTIASLLPTGQYDVPLSIQDRIFLSNGLLYYPSVGNYPQIHPYWQDSFLGNTIVVNGKVWPNMNVNQGVYRFRILDSSNSRFYLVKFSNGMSFTQIGTDGGYLKTAVPLNSLLLGPGERADILVDFSSIPAGTKIVMENGALTTSGNTEKVTIGQIMQFTVLGATGVAMPNLPSQLNPTLEGTYPTLQNVNKTRTLSLIEATDVNGTLAMYLDGQTWDGAITEQPTIGTTEEWVIANPTISAHPIHLHLVQFQIVSRQIFNDTSYMADWTALNGPAPLNHSTYNLPSLTPYLTGQSTPALASEQGWKDTATMFAGQITIIRVRFTQQDGSTFPFDATVGPGYVWHCHLLEHEDNEMMRPLTLVKNVIIITNTGIPIDPLIVGAIIVAVIVVTAIFVIRQKHDKTKKVNLGTKKGKRKF
jgi:spore coat protein A, manganese oxidase